MKKIVIGILIIFWSGENAFSSDTLSLEECINLALTKNPRLQTQRYQEQNAKYNIQNAQNNRLPNINANLGNNAVWGRGIDPFTNTYVNQQFNSYNGGVNGSIVLFNGGFHLNNIKLQKNELEKTKSQIGQIKNDITIDVMTRYTNVLYLQESIKLSKTQVKMSQENIDNAQKRIDYGSLAEREIYKFKAQRDNEKLTLVNLENQLEQNIFELKVLMNMDDNQEVYFADKSLENYQSIEVNRKEFLAHAVERYPSLRNSFFNIQSSKLNLNMAKSGFYPTINLGSNIGSSYTTLNEFQNFGEQIENNMSYGLGVNINVPIFSQLQTRNRVNIAKNNVKLAEVQYQLDKQSAMRILNKAYIDYNSAMERYFLSKSARKSNVINYDSEKIKYEVGRSSSIDLITAKSNLNSTDISLVQTKYQAIFNYLVLKLYEGE